MTNQMQDRHDQSINQLRDDLARQQRRISELERQLADARNGKLPADEHIDPELIYVSSMVSSKTGDPMVTLRWFTHLAQLPIDAAREIAFNLLDAAEAAKGDALLMKWLKDSVGISDRNQRAQLLIEFRDLREKSHGR